jgi:hypothetical protein
VVHSREKKGVHCGEQQEGTPLGEGSVVEQGEHTCIVGDAPTDGRIDEAAVALDGGGKAAEVVG